MPPRFRSVQNEYVALSDFSMWKGCFRGHFNVVSHALQTEIRLHDEQNESNRRHMVVW